MTNRKSGLILAAAALPLAVLSLQVAGAGTAAAAIPAGCSTSYSNGGQTGNVVCPTGGGTAQIRAVVTCRGNAGNLFQVYGEWKYRPGTSSGTCSLNGTAGVSSINAETRNKG